MVQGLKRKISGAMVVEVVDDFVYEIEEAANL